MTVSYHDVYVITAPSGTGKTTLNRRLVQEIPELEISISLTTRTRREGEVNGDHYWFVDKQAFFAAVARGKMLEWAEVFGNYYGTSLDEVARIANRGKKTLLEIDVQGWQQARVKLPGAVSIFILPPSLAILWDRLQSRGTDTLAAQWRRISSARYELDHCEGYDHLIVNDNLEEAYQELKRAVSGEELVRLTRNEGLEHAKRLIEEFDQAPWLQEIRAKLRT